MITQDLEKRNKILERRWKITLVVAIVFLFSRPIAVYIVDHIVKKASQQALCQSSYAYINKSTVCDPLVISKVGYASTQEQISDYLKQQKDAGMISDAALFFRDLRSGPVWGVNETDSFAPASLLKLPLALVYLEKADDDPALLQEKLSYAPHPPWENLNQYFQPSHAIVPNVDYTIEDLLQYMLKYSDNNAYGLLQKHLLDTHQAGLISEVFLELGIITPKDIYDPVINVKRYTSIFTLLYNSSFLSPQLSEKILGWLIQGDFEQGLRAGVPDDILVADKFGERLLPDGTKQLHDCGIIYYPKNPYELCVMTRGEDFNALAKVISHISDLIYGEVNSRKL